MSKINCDACSNLREYAPGFVQNGVTDVTAASLKNNTGLNPNLSVQHKNCEDLNDINDCLIGRMPQELEGYDVCDWKEYMGKFLPNLYESEKAQIASACGLWTRTEGLCSGIDALFSIIGGTGATPHAFKPIEAGLTKWKPAFAPSKGPIDPADCHFTLEADILEGAGCDASRRFSRFRVWCGPDYYPPGALQVFTFGWEDIQTGDKLAVFYKDEIVPRYMPEALWQRFCYGGDVGNRFCSIGDDTVMYVGARGHIIIGGTEFNADLAEYGLENMVLEVGVINGPTHTGASSGAVDNVRVYPF